MLFDIAMTILFWVEFWSIGRQQFDMDFGMFRKMVLHLLASVDACSIPNQNDPARNVSLKMFESFNDFLTVNCTFKMSFVDFA